MVMKRNIMLVAAVAILAVLLSGAGQAISIRAAIENECIPSPDTIIVPAGKTATNFALEDISAGVNCYTGMTIKDKGWAIYAGDSSGTKVYQYEYYVNQYGDGKSEEPYGPLGALSLSSGSYMVYVDGGKGAYVHADYDLV